jgi:fibronectin-binding autotransporter adhesin
MSVASQFFPSGGGGTSTSTPTLKTNMLLVGGGGGGNPAPTCAGTNPTAICGGGGGGGGGEVIEFMGTQINSGTQITVTVGSGGAVSSDGGNSCLIIGTSFRYIAQGGHGSPATPRVTTPCYKSITSSVTQSSGRGGNGANCTSNPELCGCPGGSNYFGLPAYQCCCCAYYYNRDEVIIQTLGGSGGLAYNGARCVCNNGTFYVGGGGGGGGGATCSGPCGSPYGCCSPSVACAQAFGGCGRAGGQGYITTIFGSNPQSCPFGVCSLANGGGGGGGNNVATTLCIPCGCQACNYIGTPGPGLCSGGDGGRGEARFSSPGPSCNCPATSGTSATANTGGGGGGGGGGACNPVVCPGGAGGSGLVVIQYPTVYPAAPAPTRPGSCDCSPSTPGCYTYKFNGPGSITLP